jgi:hypothetical protein
MKHGVRMKLRDDDLSQLEGVLRIYKVHQFLPCQDKPSYLPSSLKIMPTLRLGSTAPDFDAQTTKGPIKFHDWIGDTWVGPLSLSHRAYNHT